MSTRSVHIELLEITKPWQYMVLEIHVDYRRPSGDHGSIGYLDIYEASQVDYIKSKLYKNSRHSNTLLLCFPDPCRSFHNYLVFESLPLQDDNLQIIHVPRGNISQEKYRNLKITGSLFGNSYTSS